MTNSKWFWILVGILISMFVIPMVSGMLGNLRNKG